MNADIIIVDSWCEERYIGGARSISFSVYEIGLMGTTLVLLMDGAVQYGWTGPYRVKQAMQENGRIRYNWM